MEQAQIGIGMIGYGHFAHYALPELLAAANTKLIAVSAGKSAQTDEFLNQRGVKEFVDPKLIFGHPEVDLIYIATPPFLHYPQANQALRNGKHVIVEKPICLKYGQAKKLKKLAERRNLLFVTNFLQRYTPTYRALENIFQEGLLGPFIHGYFENYGSDGGLGPDHWFWDRRASGGIFVEHGVHFFDMFNGWLGDGSVVAAERLHRPKSNIEDQVACAVKYSGNAIVNFYHGFHQAALLDRQELRLVFERGDVRCGGWIPTETTIEGLLSPSEIERLKTLFPDSSIVKFQFPAGSSEVMARGHHLKGLKHLILKSGSLEASIKDSTYRQALRDFFTDQLKWIGDRKRQRQVSAANAVAALKTALEADSTAKIFR